MKINVSDFFKEIGTVFENPENIYSAVSEKGKEQGEEPFLVLPKGTFIILGKDSHGFDLYDIKNNKLEFLEEGWLPDEDYTFDIFYINPLETVELLIEGLNKKIIQLTSEGWEPGKDYFDLSPYLGMLNSLVQTKGILEQTELREI